MSSPRFATSSRAKRQWILVASGALGVLLFLSLGLISVSVDPLQHADAIYVLGGSRIGRAMEAVRLYREGYAPTILLSPGGHDAAEDELARQGIHVPNEADAEREVLVGKLGIPAPAVLILPREVDNTAQEAQAVEPLAAGLGWKKLIIITDKVSTRRAGYAFRRQFGDRLAIIVRCTRDDEYDPARWWSARWSVRLTFYEVPKLVAYWFGLRG